MIYLHHTALNKNADFFNAFINNVKGFYKGILSNPEYYFQIAVDEEKNIENDRYLGFPGDEDFDAINYDKTYDFHVDRFADANDFSYYFVGNFDTDILEKLVETYLGSLPATDDEDEIVVPEFRQKDVFNEFIVEKGTDPKSFVNIDWIEEDIDSLVSLMNNDQIPEPNLSCKNCAYSEQYAKLVCNSVKDDSEEIQGNLF